MKVLRLLALCLCASLALSAQRIPGVGRFVNPAVGGVDPVAAERLIYGGTWEGKVGIEGGIPSGSYTQCVTSQCDTVTSAGTAATAAQVSAALSSAADDTYVLLTTGTYSASTNILISNSNTELRGATDGNGLPATTINFTGGAIDLLGLGSYSGVDLGSAGGWTSRDVSSPAVGSLRGISTVTLASAPTGMVTNQTIVFVASEGGDDFYGFGSSGNGLTWAHWARVSAVSGSDVTFSPAISADYLTGTVAVKYKAGVWMTRKVGFRNLTVTQTDGGDNTTGFYGCDECWIYNSNIGQSDGGSEQHVMVYACFRCQIERNNIHSVVAYGNSSYGVKSYWAGGLLVLNNYFHDLANVMPMFNTHGSVFAYNYINALGYDAPTGWLSQIVFDHGAQQDYNLYEGNWLAQSNNDNSGSSRNVIWFRNRMRSHDTDASTGAATSNRNVLTYWDGYSYRTAACNVLGENGVHDTVQRLFTMGVGNGENNDGAIYNLENDHDDLMIRIGNYNTVDDAVPAGEALSAGQACVTSYLFSSKPAWFGSLPWPWVDTANFTQSNTSTNLPAGYFAANGVWP